MDIRPQTAFDNNINSKNIKNENTKIALNNLPSYDSMNVTAFSPSLLN